MSEANGGPAFPTENAAQTGATTWRYEGMSLRDYFAAQIIAGSVEVILSSYSQHESAEKRAKTAYLMADAMLEARETP